MNEIMQNEIHIYTGEIDEEDSSEIREIRVSRLMKPKIVRFDFFVSFAGCRSFFCCW